MFRENNSNIEYIHIDKKGVPYYVFNREYFMHIFNIFDCRIGAEIGVMDGVHAEHLLGNLPQLEKLYLIDPWKHYPEEIYDDSAQSPSHYQALAEEDGNANQEIQDSRFEKVNRLFADNKKVIIIRKESIEAVCDIGEELDFVYIDANHRYEFVMADLVAWYEKVRRGGLICGHDTNIKNVKRAVMDFCRLMDISGHGWGWFEYSSWFFEKK